MSLDKDYIVEKINVLKKIFDPAKNTYNRLDKIDAKTSYYEIRNEIYTIKDFFYLPTFLKDYLFFIEMNLDALIEQDTLSVKQETITEKKTEEIISCMDELAIRIGNNSREFKDLATLEEKEAYLKELKTLITRLKLNKLKEVEQEEASEILAVEEPDYEEDYQPNFVNILKRTAASANVIVFATTLVILFIFVMFAILLQLIF